MSDGYLRLLFGLTIIAFTVWFIRLKVRSIAYLKELHSNEDLHKIVKIQRTIRQYTSVVSGVAGGLAVFWLASNYGLGPFFHWLGFSFPDVVNGYEAGVFVLWNLIRLVALTIATALSIGAAILLGYMIFWISFMFFVFGSLIQIPFMVHFAMTGIYAPPSLFYPEFAWVPLALGVVTFTLSDIANLFVFALDYMITGN